MICGVSGDGGLGLASATGVTVIFPHGGNPVHSRVPAAAVVGNGFGKLVGFTQVNELGEFYTLAVVFGAAYGGGMPLYAAIARGYFGQHIMGTVFGAATMLSSLGMSLGPLLGGWVFDTYHNYAWLYISSAALAVGAVLLAFTFPKTKLQFAT